MRLIDAKTHGFGRLAEAHVNLDAKVIAIVGPNEAGKTTLLRALSFLSESRPLSTTERSRTHRPDDDDIVVEARFRLEESDLAVLGSVDVEQLPEVLHIARTADGGGPIVWTTPRAVKPQRQLAAHRARIIKAVDRTTLGTLVRADSPYVEDPEGPTGYRSELARLNGLIVDEPETHSELVPLTEALADGLVESKQAAPLKASLRAIGMWAGLEDPQEVVNRTLIRRLPRFLLFGDGDRTLSSTYEINDQMAQQATAALRNLSSMAGLDLSEFVSAYREDDIGRRDSILVEANKNLAERFRSAWRQSDLTVRFAVDGPWLRVQVLENEVKVTVFDERSAGLRMFVALVAFLSTEKTRIAPILLIDEAETHLHIDAQADLVEMFVVQDRADRIVYTTHSPACLPPDLGTGIRAVEPDALDPRVSVVRSSFWTDGPGFSPLMTAMGAAAAAFTLGRRVVLAEGAADMVLAPSLLRDATGESQLMYQVAPGLSNVAKDFYPNLDLEGARVVYLLDSDAGGDGLRKGLVAAGIAPDRIVVGPVPGIENAVDPEMYLRAVAALLAESNPGVEIPALPGLGKADASSWARKIEVWAGKNDLKVPSKVAVASRLVEDGAARVSGEMRNAVKELHLRLMCALGLETE